MPTKEKGCLRRFLAKCIIFLMGFLSLSIPAVAADAKLTTVERLSQEGQTSPQPMIRASRVLDRTVYNERGEEIGEVNDLIMSRNGKIKKVILSVGKFLETGEKLVAVPFGSLEENNKGVIYRVTREQIKHHPRFNYWTEGLFGGPLTPFLPMGRDGDTKPRLLPQEGTPVPWVEGENTGERFTHGNGGTIQSVCGSAPCWMREY
jgi:sporulation protein YlmC with PRC-barrel domain